MPSAKHKLVKATLSITALVLLLLLLLTSPLGRVVDQRLTNHFRYLNARREQHQFTWLNGVECHLLYNIIAIAGRIISPEGGAIIWGYLYGEGADLVPGASSDQ